VKQHHFIYKTTNRKNGKYYIGKHSTDNLEDGYLGSGKRLRYAINKCGRAAFERIILEFVDRFEELDEAEARYVTVTEVRDPRCYNLTLGGQGGNGFTWIGKHHTQETRELLREKNIGKKLSEEHKAKIRAYRHTPEAIEKIRMASIGRTHNPESCEKISKARVGMKFSEEHKKNLSLAHQKPIVR